MVKISPPPPFLQQLILPILLVEGGCVRSELPELPGILHLSIDEAVEECRRASGGGVTTVCLFCAQAFRSPDGGAGRGTNSLIARGASAIRNALPHLRIISDVCVCSYTTHGHCLLTRGESFDSEWTAEELSQQALDHARAGVSAVMPSSMALGVISKARRLLDANNFSHVEVIAQTAKFASNYYRAFRSISGITDPEIDKSYYQISPQDRTTATSRLLQELRDGASAVMAKPILGYLDCVAALREETDVPVYGFLTSGESSLLASSYTREERTAVLERIFCAGADMVLTSLARDY